MNKSVNILKPTLTLIKFSSLSLEPENEWLIKIITSYDILNDNIINKLSNITEIQRAFLRNSLNKEAERIALEWNSIGDVSIPNTESNPCQLCGNVCCKEFYIIKNKFTSIELLVGSSCIQKFPSINKSFGKDGVKKVVYLNRLEREKYNRENIITMEVGSKEDTFLGWYNMKYDFVLDYDTDIKRKGLIASFVDRYNNYINKGCFEEQKLFDDLNRIKKEINILNNKIKVKQVKCNILKFDCPFYVEKWLETDSQSLIRKDNTYKFLLDDIKKNQGKVNGKTIRYLYNNQYVNDLRDYINLKLMADIQTQISFVDNAVHFIIKNYKIDFFMETSIFMYNFGPIIVDDSLHYSFNNLLELISINFKDEDSIEKLIEIFNTVMKKTIYKVISLKSKFENGMEVINYYLYNKQQNTYASEHKIDYFLKGSIKFILLENRENACSNITKIIHRISKWDYFNNLKKYK